MSTSPDKASSIVFRRQHGAMARAQLDELEFTETMIKRRVNRGRWDSPMKGVFRVAGAPRTWKQSLMVATLAGYPDAAISHAAAYALWDIEPFARHKMRPGPEIVTPRWEREQHRGLKVHESKELEADDYATVDGIPVIHPVRLVSDLPYYATDKEIELAIDDTVRRKLGSYARMAARLGEMQPRGRRGYRKLARLLDARCQRTCQVAPDSGLVTLIGRDLVRAGVPTPEFEIEVEVDGVMYRVDAGWVRVMKGLNVNGSRHEMPSRQAWDALRAERLIRAGWDMRDVWWPEYRSDRRGCIERLVEWYRAS